MRQIGTLPKDTDPARFVDHLEAIGVTSRVMDSKEGWAIWVHNENKIDQAREEFAAYTTNPDDPRFDSAAESARKVRQKRRGSSVSIKRTFATCAGGGIESRSAAGR